MTSHQDFEALYESTQGTHVRLDGAHRVDPAGNDYVHHRLVTAHGQPGAVILAVQGAEVLFAHARRDYLAHLSLELPRGSWDPVDSGPAERQELRYLAGGRRGTADSDLLDEQAQLALCNTAARELREETGYRIARAQFLGGYVTDTSIYPQRVGVIHCVVDAGKALAATDGELAGSSWTPLTELPGLIAKGRIADAHSLAALALWQAATAR
ncbi:NUDIX domain-containing protein [Glutamicibacter ardleyensis]|uniref:NUDIX domain-containing protein n=1 Tax=Glutamicibacter ardleyensis TaxID=225894 RepID=UPI003FD1C2C7